MSNLIYKHAAVMHFRRLGEAWRAEAKTIRAEIRTKRAEARTGGIPFDQIRTEHCVDTARADLYDKLGKELKELASDVLHGRVGCL